MLDPDEYSGREQTYVKHYVLKTYIERVAYKFSSFEEQFIYVDGFSGPWKSENENYDDTSFKIAIDQLRDVKRGVKERWSKDVHFRCLFIEKTKRAFGDLEVAVGSIEDVEIKLINGSFKDSVEDICNFVGRSFSLIFIDPTGWQGFAMQKISPLLNLRGEVLRWSRKIGQ
jgi:three-Cys-motif partner protein